MTEQPHVAVVGGGVGGLNAAIFTARAGLPTTILSAGESILNRNAHIENFPGFPAGINPRLLLELTREQAHRAGVQFETARIEQVSEAAGGFELESDSDRWTAEYVVAASWSDPSYLSDLDVDLVDRGSKTFVGVETFGATDTDGLYAAGRLAEQHHQAIVAAGHGAQVGLAIVEDSDVDFYHDWTVPEGYFTDRGRPVPPGCEEIGDEERERRERESMELMREYFTEPHPSEPTMHPSLEE